MRDIFVVAGNRKQFLNLMTEAQAIWDYEIKNKMVHYVSHPSELECALPSRVFLYGTYFKRPDFAAIDLVIKSRGHRRLLIR